MLAYAAKTRSTAGRTGSPKALFLIVAGHAVLIGAVMATKMEMVSGKLDPQMGGPGFQDFVIEKPEHSPHYRYDLAELEAFVPAIVDVARRTQGVHVVFNNCHANYGTDNADEIAAIIRRRDALRRGVLDAPG